MSDPIGSYLAQLRAPVPPPASGDDMDSALAEMRNSLRPMKQPLAPAEATQQTFAQRNPQAEHLEGLAAVPAQLTQMGATALQHPVETAASVAMAPVHALQTAGGYMAQSAAETSLPPDIRARALADPDRIDESDAALAGLQLALPELPFTGIVGRALKGAATGAAYMPEQPVAGAILGGAAGGLHAHLAEDPYAMGVQLQKPTITDQARLLANPETANEVHAPPLDIDETLARYREENRLQRAKELYDQEVGQQAAAAAPEAPTPEPAAEPAAEPVGAAAAQPETQAEAPPEAAASAMPSTTESETPELDAVLAEMRANEAKAQQIPNPGPNEPVGSAAPFLDGQGKEVPTVEDDMTPEQQDAERDAASAAAPPPLIPQGPHPAPQAPGIPSRGGGILTDAKKLPSYLVAMFNPRAASPAAYGTGATIRSTSSFGGRDLAIARKKLADLSQAVGGMDRTSAINLINLYERTERGLYPKTGDAKMDAMLKVFKQISEQYEAKLVAIGKLEPTMISYIGRYVVQPQEEVTRMINAIQSKRPMYGPESFSKGRTWPYFTDMLDAGGTPVSYNFVDLQMLKYEEMQRVLDMYEAELQERSAGRWKNVMVGRNPPVDANGNPWVRIGDGKDPATTVYGPKSEPITEAYDAKIRAGLERAIRSIKAAPGFGDLKHQRLVKLPKKRGEPEPAGLAYTHGNLMQSKFATPETVIMHELGHILDFRYHLGDYLRAGSKKMQATLAEELENLGLERSSLPPDMLKKVDPEHHAYITDKWEVVANAMHAYLYAPELMKSVAPHVQKRLAEWLDGMARGGHQFAKELQNLKPSLQLAGGEAQLPIPGIRIMGYAYAPQGSAQVWNNNLSKGLGGNPIYRLWRAPANAAVRAMLSLSGFHFTTTSFNAVFGELGRQMQRAINPGFTAKERLEAFALGGPRAAIAPITQFALGNKILQEFQVPGLHPELQQTLHQMLDGGFKVAPAMKEHLTLMLQGIKNATEATSMGERLKAGASATWNLPWAIVEQLSRPIMGGWVARMKAGAAYSQVANDMKYAQGPMTRAEVQKSAGTAIDNVDFLLGQVMRDNHFVHRVADNLASALLLAPGWTVGTQVFGVKAGREMGQFAGDAVRGRRPTLGPNAAYAIAMVIGTAVWGAMTQKILTGQDPQSPKDLFFPMDGTYDEDGNPNRINPATYLTHDFYGYATHPLRTILGKLNPALSTAGYLIKNQDYFGNDIRNTHDSALKQAGQVASFAAKTYVPLSIRNYTESKRRNDKGIVPGGGSFWGFTPASKETIRSPAQNLMNELLVAHGHAQLTPENAVSQQERSIALHQLRNGVSDAFTRLVAEGKMSHKQINNAMKSIAKVSLVQRFQQLTLPEAQMVMEQASPVERAMWQPSMQQKIRNEANTGRTYNLTPH